MTRRTAFEIVALLAVWAALVAVTALTPDEVAVPVSIGGLVVALIFVSRLVR